MVTSLWDKKSMKAFVFMLSVLVSLSFYLWGVTLTDNYFWIYSCKEAQEMVMCLLSLLGMKAWFSAFGFTLLSQRLLTWGMNLLTLLIPYFGLLKGSDRSKYVYYLCSALVILGPGIAKCCTPDTFTSVLMAIAVVSFVKMLGNKRFLWFLSLSVSTALLIAARFPNVVAVPLIAMFMLFLGDKNRITRWKYALGYVVLSMVLYWGVMTLLLGETNCFSLLADSFSQETGNVNGRHSMVGLLLRYCKSILLAMIALFGIVVACCTNRRLFPNKQKLGIAVSILLGTIICYGILGRIGEKFHSWPVCVAPLVSLPLFYVAYKAYREKSNRCSCLCLFLGMVIYVPSAGSDTGFQKSLMVASAILPIAAVYVRKKVKQMTNVKLALGIMIVTSLLMYNDGICANNSMSSDAKLQGILLPKWQLESNQEIKQGLKPWFKMNHTVFYGLEAHYWYFYTDSKLMYNPGFWMLQNEKVALGKAVDAVKIDKDAVLVDFTYSDKDYLLKQGLKLVADGDKFRVYKRE